MKCFVLVLGSALALWSQNVSARVVDETLCFSGKSQQGRHIELRLRKYLDLDLQQEVGAIAQYGTSRAVIPLVFTGSGSSDPLVDYELHWVEIVDGKVGGEYSLIKAMGSTIGAAYVRYRTTKGGETIFLPMVGVEGDCVIRR